MQLNFVIAHTYPWLGLIFEKFLEPIACSLVLSIVSLPKKNQASTLITGVVQCKVSGTRCLRSVLTRGESSPPHKYSYRCSNPHFVHSSHGYAPLKCCHWSKLLTSSHHSQCSSSAIMCSCQGSRQQPVMGVLPQIVIR